MQCGPGEDRHPGERDRLYQHLLGEKAITLDNDSFVGLLSASDFVDSISDVNAFTDSEIVLYFSDGTGEYLVPESRKVIYNINTPIERTVVEELIHGPETEGLKPVILPTTRLISVSTADSVCYLNFNDDFLTAVPDVKDYIPLYAIVNSLSELPSISKVQIMVSASQNVLFRETISLEQTFERNLDYQLKQ